LGDLSVGHPDYVSKITCIKLHQAANFPLTSAQKPAFCIPSGPSILFTMTIQNHALDVSRAIVIVKKAWFG
jgi:hypothetical protein